MEPDFSGWASKAGLKCSDGRTIMPDAFKHQDKMQVPLVWAHDHSDPEKVLGYAILEHRDEGVYCYGYLNESNKGLAAKKMLQHGDIKWLSIYANRLVERSKQVFHGAIREVSLVLAGANPGAEIDYVSLQHGENGEDIVDGSAEITTGLEIELPTMEHAEGKTRTVQEIYDAFDEEERAVVHRLIDVAVETAIDGIAAHSDEDGNVEGDNAEGDNAEEGSKDESENTDDSDDKTNDADSGDSDGDTGDAGSDNNSEGNLNHQEGTDNMSRNVFDQDATGGGLGTIDRSKALTHDQLKTIVKVGRQSGSFKEALLMHAEEYGITDINLLFPDAKALSETPQFISRRMEWVSKVLGGTKHLPFAKVKSLFADITEPEARAKGYLKGNRKKEEVFKLLKRTTGPATIYKKQKLDRDDILDITEIDVINWLKAEMRIMLEEEIARAILVGDGRSSLSEDKVADPEGAVAGDGIRSILNDDPLFVIRKSLPSNVLPKDAVKAVIRAQDEWKGTGTPTAFVARGVLTEMLLDEDRFGRPLYANRAALADKLGVDEIVTVDIFPEYAGLYMIIVNLQDYSIGTNAGGELTSFEDFDIDFNQNKYLQETRLSGGLTRPFSAIVIRRELGTAVTPTGASFDAATDTVTVPDQAGVEYYNAETDSPVTGSFVITEPTEIRARAEEGYHIPVGSTTSWSYTP